MQIESKVATGIEFRLDEPLLSLEEQLLKDRVNIETWFRSQWQKTQVPFYGSVDIRNAGFKIAPVDTNLFPAGFNNLNPEFLSLYVQAAEATVAELLPNATRILLIPESHTRNLYYFESVNRLKELLIQAGLDVRLGSLSPEFTETKTFALPSGEQLTIEPIQRQGDRVGVKDFFPCCIILNNDLSSEIPDILQNTTQKILPPFQLGWS